MCRRLDRSFDHCAEIADWISGMDYTEYPEAIKDEHLHLLEVFGSIAHYIALMSYFERHHRFPYRFTTHDRDDHAAELAKDIERFGVISWPPVPYVN